MTKTVHLAAMPPESASERLESAIEMQVLGIDMKRERLKRQHPSASAEELLTLLNAWLIGKPEVEAGFRVRVP